MMARIHRTLARFAALFRKRQLEEELDEDSTTHLELLTDEYVARGMDRATARREARLRFGSTDSAKEVHQDSRSLRWLENVFLDLRYAARLLRRQPLLTAAVVLTLGIGLGAPTTVFGLLNAFIFRTPVSRDPDAFFRVVRTDGSGSIATVPQYLTLKKETTTSVRELAAWSSNYVAAPLGLDDPSRVSGLPITCNFFRVFGVDRPTLGRLLEEADCDSASPVAVISEHLWQGRFGEDPSIVGTSIHYGGVPVTIVGVASAPSIRREAHDAGPDFSAGLWFPLTFQTQLWKFANFNLPNLDRHPFIEIVGLLRPGYSRQAATAEFRAIESRDKTRGSSSRGAAILTDGARWAITSGELDEMLVLGMVLALPTLIMVIACVNVAALLLARATARQREMAVRLALGTSRSRLVQLLLIETGLMFGLAVVAGLFVVYLLPPVIIRFFDAELTFGAADRFAPDWRVFTWLGVSAVIGLLISGLAPILESINPRLAEALHGRRTFLFRRGTSRTRRMFVGIQVAASMVPLVIAITFSLTATRFTEPGFNTHGLVFANMDEQQNGGATLSFVADTLAASAGVDSIAYAEHLPLLSESAVLTEIPGRPGAWWPLAHRISPDYFSIFGIPILAGRPLTRLDATQTGGPRPVVVSRQFARRLFGREDVLGEVVSTTRNRGAELKTIVGISADRVTRRSFLGQAMTDGSSIYELMPPESASGYLVVKTKRDVGALAKELPGRLRELTGTAMPVQTYASRLADNVTWVGRAGFFLMVLGAVALFLAIVGVVGIVWFDASQKRKEFAIRFALGSGPAALRRSVLLSGLRPVSIGVVFGLLVSWGTAKVAESQRILPLNSFAQDPRPYVAVSIVLLLIATLTLAAVAYPVGRRDPLQALREE